jgi:methylmalonyl-CoA mutase, C-terminal domain
MPIKVLVAKPGLDGHDRGAKVLARSLRDAGMEVVYTGLHQTPEMIVNAAIQEDVDVVGVSILSGAHMTVFPKIMELLKEREVEDIVVLGGGVIQEDDVPKLKAIGVREIFNAEASTQDLITGIERIVAEYGRDRARRASASSAQAEAAQSLAAGQGAGAR